MWELKETAQHDKNHKVELLGVFPARSATSSATIKNNRKRTWGERVFVFQNFNIILSEMSYFQETHY